MAKEKKLYTATVTLPNGKRKYIRAKTKAELERKRNELKAQIGAGVLIGNDSTVAQVAQTWFDVYKRPYLRVGSQESVKYVVNKWILPKLGSMRVSDVKPVHIRAVMANQEGMSDSLQKKTLQALRGIFLCAEESHLIVKSPVTASIKAGGKPVPEKVPLTTEQSRQLLQAVAGTRAYIAIAVMLGAGLRREEACGLMWQDIDFEAGTLTVNRALPFYNSGGQLSDALKSKAAYRTIPMPTWLTEALLAEKRVSTSLYVLHAQRGGPITVSSFRKLWAIVQTRTTDDPAMLGKPIDPQHSKIKYGIDFHVHPHLLRHTCATRWFEAGLNPKEVQYLLGHSTPDITMRWYVHYLEGEQKAITAEKIQNSPLLSAVGV